MRHLTPIAKAVMESDALYLATDSMTLWRLFSIFIRPH